MRIPPAALRQPDDDGSIIRLYYRDDVYIHPTPSQASYMRGVLWVLMDGNEHFVVWVPFLMMTDSEIAASNDAYVFCKVERAIVH